MSKELKVGLFALTIVALMIFATLRVSEKGLLSASAYPVHLVLDSAQGLKPKTPVEIAGIQVGSLESLELIDSSKAKVTLMIRDDVHLPRDVKAQVRSKGFLGETYIDLQPGDAAEKLKAGDEILATGDYADFSDLSSKMNLIADDVQAVTKALRLLIEDQEKAPIQNIVANLESFTSDLKELTAQNQQDMNAIVRNLASLTRELNHMVIENRGEINSSLESIENIARKIDNGQGTIGRLINDERTVDELNEAVASLNDTLGGLNKFEVDMGYHIEYLGNSKSFKNYVELGIKPRPDSELLFEFVSDSDPSPNRSTIISEIKSGDNTQTVEVNRQVIDRDAKLFSAQLAQSLYDFRIRGGIIESRAGSGIDYIKGPFKASFSAFDFRGEGNRKPHLKAWGTYNMTKNFFLVGGIDDPLNPEIETDWFVGAGFHFVNDDLKKLVGLGAAASSQ